MTARFSAFMTAAAAALLVTSAAQAASVTRSTTTNPDGTMTYSKTTTGDTTIITPVGSDDMYVATDDPVYPVSSTTTTTTYVNGTPMKTSYSRSVNHPDDEYQDYYVTTAPSNKTYAAGVDDNGNMTRHSENMTTDSYNN